MAIARIALAAAAVAAFALTACEDPATPEPYVVAPIQPFLGQPVLGDPTAPVEIKEYASTTCGHCKAFHDEVFPKLKETYIDTGKVKLVWVVLPTAPTATSLAGAALARCAGEEKFFDVLDALFDAQDTLVDASRTARRLHQEFRDIGARFDLSPDQVRTCIDDKAVLQATRDALADLPASITGTPSFTLHGEKLDVESYEGLAAAIDAELTKIAGSPAAPQ
jgi:protein-disulfide isomerase